MLAWAIFGKADENILASSIIELAKLLFAMAVWAVIGAAIASGIIGLLALISTTLGATTEGSVSEAITQYAILGAIGGAIFRGILWPITISILNALRYRTVKLIPPTVDENSIAMYPYKNPPYNAIEMKYVGSEPIRDLEVWLTYKDKNGEVKRKQVEEFFPQEDHTMIWKQFNANFLNENELVRFRLLQNKNTEDGKVVVEVVFVGAKTGRVVKARKEFELVL